MRPAEALHTEIGRQSRFLRGAPSRLDRSYLSNLPRGAQTVFIASCKTLA